MTEQIGGARPADNRPGTDSTVPPPTDIERYRLREQRRASRDLDQLLGIARDTDASPDWDQFALGMPERRAAGLALLEQERAA